jgi:tyrosinase
MGDSSGMSRRRLLRYSGAALAVGGLAAGCSSTSTSPGPVALATKPLVRKNVKDLTPAEKGEFVAAILRLKQMRSPYSANFSYYDDITNWHLQIHQCGYYGHMSPVFMPWHRAYVQIMEQAMAQVVGRPIAIPYWDWTDQASTDATLADDFMGPYGDKADDYAVTSGPFQRGAWEVTVHSPASDDPAQFSYLVRAAGTASTAPGLPTADDMNTALSRSSYDVSPWNLSSNPGQSFRQYAEGWIGFQGDGQCVDGIMQPTVGSDPSKVQVQNHNRVHFYVGGIFTPSSNVTRYGTGYLAKTMGVPDAVYGTILPATAPNDPLFWPLHSNVDRIWHMWQQRHPNAYAPVSDGPVPQNLDNEFQILQAYTKFTTIRSVQDIAALGYTYA